MTLGRFLLFFAAGLVLAIAFPPLSWLIWPLAALAAVVVAVSYTHLRAHET